MGLLGFLGLGRRRPASGAPSGAPQAPSSPHEPSQAPSAEQQAAQVAQPPPLMARPPALAATVQRLLSSSTVEEAVAAVGQLLEEAKDPSAAALMACNAALVGRLRDAMVGASGGGGGVLGPCPPAAWEQGGQRERLAVLAAYLISSMAGKTPAADASLLGQRLLPALVAAAGAAAARGGAGAAGWGVARGALRAVAKLLEAQPALAAAQLLACGGVEEVGALLAAPDTGGCFPFGGCGVGREHWRRCHLVDACRTTALGQMTTPTHPPTRAQASCAAAWQSCRRQQPRGPLTPSSGRC